MKILHSLVIAITLAFVTHAAPSFTKMTTDPIAGVIGRCTGAAVADINGDGYPDVFVSVIFTSNLLFTNSAGKGFVKITPNPIDSGSQATAGGSWGDYDNDGWPDLLVSINAHADDVVYHNAGAGVLKRAPLSSFFASAGN